MPTDNNSTFVQCTHITQSSTEPTIFLEEIVNEKFEASHGAARSCTRYSPKILKFGHKMMQTQLRQYGSFRRRPGPKGDAIVIAASRSIEHCKLPAVCRCNLRRQGILCSLRAQNALLLDLRTGFVENQYVMYRRITALLQQKKTCREDRSHPHPSSTSLI